MAVKIKRGLQIWFFSIIAVAFFMSLITSCGKGGNASPTGLNIQYEIFNLSPDLGPVNLFSGTTQVNTYGNPYVFNVNQGYFYVSSVTLPYQIRSAYASGTTIFSLNNILQSGAKYSLFITGDVAYNSDTTTFTVDTATADSTGRGKLRFFNASPTATGGLDLYANGTLVHQFSGIVYLNSSPWVQLPAGNYDMKINAKGTSTTLSEQPSVTIQDGRLYTLFAYGYTTRTDSAAFNSVVITNK
jgi:hypothetical protein